MCDSDGGDGFWDMDTADFAILGGVFGYAEEECEDTMRAEIEVEKDQEEADRFNNGEFSDDFDRSDDIDCCDDLENDLCP